LSSLRLACESFGETCDENNNIGGCDGRFPAFTPTSTIPGNRLGEKFLLENRGLSFDFLRGVRIGLGDFVSDRLCERCLVQLESTLRGTCRGDGVVD